MEKPDLTAGKHGQTGKNIYLKRYVIWDEDENENSLLYGGVKSYISCLTKIPDIVYCNRDTIFRYDPAYAGRGSEQTGGCPSRI